MAVREGKYPAATLPTRRRWPKLPTTLTLAAGPVDVVIAHNPKMKSPYSRRMWKVLGYFDSAPRRIVLREGMHPSQLWVVMLHEMTHASLYDTAAHLGLTKHQEERICEAVALGYMHNHRFLSMMAR